MHVYPKKIENVNLRFKIDSPFIDVKWDDSCCWQFLFGNEIRVNAEGALWRLLQNGKILFTSNDHMQQFGLLKPLDLIEEIKNALLKAQLLKIAVRENTGDLELCLSNNYQLEFVIMSSGYDSYSFYINRHRYLGIGNGEIAVYNV